jgi:hypothetical protein
VARPREAVGCRTLICGKADSSQLKWPSFARVFSTSPGIGTRQDAAAQRWKDHRHDLSR